MFVKLTLYPAYYEKAEPIYVNASKVVSVEKYLDGSYISDCSDWSNCDDAGIKVIESPETVVMILEEALKGGKR